MENCSASILSLFLTIKTWFESHSVIFLKRKRVSLELLFKFLLLWNLFGQSFTFKVTIFFTMQVCLQLELNRKMDFISDPSKCAQTFGSKDSTLLTLHTTYKLSQKNAIWSQNPKNNGILNIVGNQSLILKSQRNPKMLIQSQSMSLLKTQSNQKKKIKV